ncbi:hypothetical protein [Paraflavitalea speifideaquila]|uniref:hypothetical protein n=1 Tax=Paraflavitalea speifideaquila TaxID=3076558 RepID=UPI0028E504F1|nr:hypothetical protein [Paraflavitalea speifideiaquila]
MVKEASLSHLVGWVSKGGSPSSTMAMALVVNLAALPTRITIPVLFLSILADLVVIAAAITIAIH